MAMDGRTMSKKGKVKRINDLPGGN
jgi:hypothetical protein